MRPDQLLLQDIFDAIHIVRRYTPAQRSVLDTDLPIQSVLVRYIQMIGEAAFRLTDAFKIANPQVPWQRIASMRHVLVHDYFRVDLNQVWSVATVHVPVLQLQVESILASLPPEPKP